MCTQKQSSTEAVVLRPPDASHYSRVWKVPKQRSCTETLHLVQTFVVFIPQTTHRRLVVTESMWWLMPSKRTSAGERTSRGRRRPTVPSGLPTACRLLYFMMYVLAISHQKSNRDSWFLFSLGPHLCKYHELHRATSTQNAKRAHHHFLLRMEMRYRFRF